MVLRLIIEPMAQAPPCLARWPYRIQLYVAHWLHDRAGESAKHIANFSSDLARDERRERTCGFGAIGAVQIGMQVATSVCQLSPKISAPLLFQAIVRIAAIIWRGDLE